MATISTSPPTGTSPTDASPRPSLYIDCWLEPDGPTPEEFRDRFASRTGLPQPEWDEIEHDEERNLYHLVGRTTLDERGVAEAVFATLVAVGRVALRPVVSGPERTAAGRWHMSLYALADPRVPGHLRMLTVDLSVD